MPGTIPEARFRLTHTFAAQPPLTCDQMPDKSILIGQNSARESIEAVYLGKHAEAPHRNVWMDTRGAHALYVMGKRRSGKSYTLGSIAEGLISQSWVRQGELRPGVLILDTMNVYLTMPFTVEDTLSDTNPELTEARKWKIDAENTSPRLFLPEGTEVPGTLSTQPVTLKASDLGTEEWCGLFDADPFVSPLGHLIATVHAKLSSEGSKNKESGIETPAKPNFDLADMIDILELDAEVADFNIETRNALKRRLQTLQRLPLFGSDGLDVRSLLEPGRISVLLLRDLDTELRSVMVSLIIKRVMQLRSFSEQHERLLPIHLERAAKYADSDPIRAKQERDAANRCKQLAAQGLPRSWVIIDEAHNYIPARGNTPSRKPLKKYVDEGRNLGLSIVVATQQPSGLDPSIQRNADMILIHALSHQDDIVAARGMTNTSSPDEVTLNNKYKFPSNKTFEALVRNLPIGYALASSDRANRLFPIRIRPRATIHGGADY